MTSGRLDFTGLQRCFALKMVQNLRRDYNR
jgi:hypothetical protein